MTYYEYTQRFLNKNSHAGDVARDIAEDRCFPKHSTAWVEIGDHLERMGACSDCLRAAKQLYRSYRNYLLRLRHREVKANV